MPLYLCLSQDPHCCGVAPCQSCFDFLVGGRVQGQMVWPSGGVIPRAMFIAGPPFSSDVGAAAIFMRAFPQALSDGANFVAQMAEANMAAQAPPRPEVFVPQAPPPRQAPPPPRRQLTEEEYLLNFQAQMLEQAPQLSEADRLKICTGVANETLEGWDQLIAGEKEILRAIFLPPLAPPEDAEAPLPSNESAAKVVAAMRAGTLGPETLAPRVRVVADPAATEGEAPAGVPLHQQDLTAAFSGAVKVPGAAAPQDSTGAAVAPGQAPGGVAPQAPPAQTTDAVNGSVNQNGPAQAAVPNQETTTS